MSLREAALLALYALELEDMACRHEKEQTPEQIARAIAALHAALAEPKWSALTLDEVLDCAKDFEGQLPQGWMKIVEAVDARLREKNT